MSTYDEIFTCPQCGGEAAEKDCPECDGLGDLGGPDGPGERCETCDGLGTMDGTYECLECGHVYTEHDVVNS